MTEISALVTSASKVPRAKPKDELGTVFGKVASSHDPVFIFDNNRFLGIVSGSYSFFKKRYPRSTKVDSAKISPPRIHKNESIVKISEHMISTKIYSLPIFENDEIIGIVTARSILNFLLSSPQLLTKIEGEIKYEKPVTVGMHAKVGEVYSLLRKEKTSRVIVLDESKKKMKGILTRRDLQKVFTNPLRKGVAARTKNNRTYTIDDKDLKKFDFPIAEFIVTNVVKLPVHSGMRKILEVMLDRKVNSIILVDKDILPKGIISVRTFLETLSKMKEEIEIPIIFSDRHALLQPGEKERILSLLQKLGKKVHKIQPIKEITISLNGVKNPVGIVMEYELHLHMNLLSGKMVDTKVKRRKVTVALREAVQKLNSQLKLNHKERAR